MPCPDLSSLASVFSLFSLGALQHSKIWDGWKTCLFLPILFLLLMLKNYFELGLLLQKIMLRIWNLTISIHTSVWRLLTYMKERLMCQAMEFSIYPHLQRFLNPHTVDIVEIGGNSLLLGEVILYRTVKSAQQCPWPSATRCWEKAPHPSSCNNQMPPDFARCPLGDGTAPTWSPPQ